MSERDRFDCNNLGGFRRSYPNPDNVSGLADFAPLTHLDYCFGSGFANEVRVHARGVKGTVERVYERYKAIRAPSAVLQWNREQQQFIQQQQN